MSVPSHRRRVAALVLAGLLGPGALAGCRGGEPTTAAGSTPSASTGSRPVTLAEAERLAVARFNAWDRGVVPVRLSLPAASGQLLSLAGRADLRRHRAVAAFATDDRPPAYGVLAWTLRRVGLRPTARPVSAAGLTRQASRGGWQVRPVSVGDPLTAPLGLLLSLAADRPENAQLLRQGGATWLGATTVDGTAVDLMAATSTDDGARVTYYVDDRGGLVRADVEVGLDRPASLVFEPGSAPPVPRLDLG